MTKAKKFNLLIVSVLLAFAGCFLFACGKPNYNNVTLTCDQPTLLMDIGDEKELTFTINNYFKGMDNHLEEITWDPADKISVDQYEPSGNQTTIRVTALEGGTVYLHPVTKDGGKDCNVTIVIREYSDVFTPKTDVLYVTSSTPFIPNQSQFNFKESANQRDLSFYFYGKKGSEGDDLTVEDIQEEGEFVQRFTAVNLINQGSANYLIFEDGNSLYTLASRSPVSSELNTKYTFIPASFDDGLYTFDGQAQKITLGDEFTFVAIYNDGMEQGLDYFASRSFNVYADIDSSKIEYSYTYPYDEERHSGEILLVPNRKNYLDNPTHNTVNLQVKLNAGLLLDSDFEGDLNVFSTTGSDGISDGGQMIFNYEITSRTLQSRNGVLRLNYFYPGLQDSTDPSVSYWFEIPVSVTYLPEEIVVNNRRSGEGQPYTFYNNYGSDNDGWQNFKIDLSPNDAAFNYLTIYFEDGEGNEANREVEVVYNGSHISSGTRITDLSYPLQIRGGNKLTDAGQITLVLTYDILGENEIEYLLGYKVIAGADNILATDDDFLELNDKEKGIFLSSDETAIAFRGLYATQAFSRASLRFLSGDNVVALTEEIACDTDEGNALVMNLRATGIGSGKYTITLDNGVYRTVMFRVIESFTNFNLQIEDNNVVIDNITNNSADVYVLNDGNFNRNIQMQLIAGEGANVIADSKRTGQRENGFRINKHDSTSSAITLGILTQNNGSGYVKFAIDVIRVRDFKYVISETPLEYTINIVSYSRLGQLQVYKTQDGKDEYKNDNGEYKTQASYAYVYIGTENASARSATFLLQGRDNGYMFINPAWREGGIGAKYLFTEFSNKAVYWTTSAFIQGGSDRMYIGDTSKADNTYVLGNYGTFNTETLTFTAYSYATHFSLDLTCNVSQIGITYSFTIQIEVDTYQNVETITMQQKLENNELNFSPNGGNKHHELIISATPLDATNASLTYKYLPASDEASFFGEKDEQTGLYPNLMLSPIGSGRYILDLTLAEQFIESDIAQSEESLSGVLRIVATDWLDEYGNIMSIYQNRIIEITLNYENGTKGNPFHLVDADDVDDIRNALSAHYKIANAINISSVSLPLGDFSGSIEGTSDYAQMYGINITNSSNLGNNYGLFSSITEQGSITNVKFSGHINVQNVHSTSNVGLVAGVNSGKLTNLGVTVDADSTVSLLGSANVGMIVGRNDGTIAQDFAVYTALIPKLDNAGNTVKDDDGNVVMIGDAFYGLSPKILLFMDQHKLTVNAGGNPANIGGIAGLNSGNIFKFDNDDIKLLNYGNYLVYANILVNNSVAGSAVGLVAGQSTTGSSIAGGNAREIVTQDDISKTVPRIIGERTAANSTEMKYGGYRAGMGILVGGEVSLGSQGYAGGVVGKYEDSTVSLYGITTRAYVRGREGHVGAMVGDVSSLNSTFTNIYQTGAVSSNQAAGTYSPFAIQAVDDGRLGENSSMVVVTLDSLDESQLPASKPLSTIAFGSNVQNVPSWLLNDNNVLSYSRRSQEEISDGKLEVNSITANASYGDYVEIGRETDGKSYVYGQKFFARASVQTQVEANDGFAQFINNPNVFYAYYFNASSSDVDLPDARAALESLNKVSVASKLYPLKVSGDLSLTSLASDVIEIDESGVITIKKAGYAEVKLVSILNSNDERTIYIKSTNYFNQDKDLSIVYESDNLSVPIGKTSIPLKGNQTINFIVKPNYLLIDENGKQIFDANGNGVIDGIAITLAPNTDIEIGAKITSFVGSNGIKVPGSELVGDQDLIVSPNGQSLSIMRDRNTLEGTYHFHIWTQISYNLGSSIAVAKVNREMSEDSTAHTTVVYTKGAEKIETRFRNLPVYTNKEMTNTIFITSSSEEDIPTWVVEDEFGNSINLFNVLLRKTGRDNSGRQTFALTISVNKASDAYLNRYRENIYKDYTLYVYAESNDEVFIPITITLNMSEVKNITVENYKDLGQSTSVTSPSSIAVPGKEGLLVVTLDPTDADFDYIEIVNTDLAKKAGNGSADFSLIAKNTSNKDTATGQRFDFDTDTLVGTILTNGLRFTQSELTEYYARDGHENYRGIIYLSYFIGTDGTIDGGVSQFKIIVYKDKKPVYESEPFTYNLELEYRVSLSLDATVDETGVYHVARGLEYKVNLDYYGFDFNDVDVQVPARYADYITKRQVGNTYYIQVERDISYEGQTARRVQLIASAYQKEGDNERSKEFSLDIDIHEYVVKYQYDSSEGTRDIVDGMDRGVIRVQVGNILTLSLDASQLIEYSSDIPDVATKVNNFITQLNRNGVWTSYTNLNSSGYPLNTPVDINNPGQTFTVGQKAVSNIYFRSNGLNVTPMITHAYQSRYYLFTFDGYYLPSGTNGVYEAFSDSNNNARYHIYTTFVLDVYQSSSSENPIPVYNYDELLAMQPNSHYILLSDITLPNDFTPITTQIASLDGNGYTIYFNGDYAFEGTNIGLFDTIGTGTIIKNVTIALSSNVSLSTSAASFTTGLLAGINNGYVTNCYVYSGSDEYTATTYILTASCQELDSVSYVGGLVGRNSGYITNSRSEVYITSAFNIGGLVGQNTNAIASSYVKNVVIRGTSEQGHAVGGLVVVNEENGRITTSYVSGEPNQDRVYSTDTAHRIFSTTEKGGFVHTNKGKISDCYSNIKIEGSSTMAGFVHDNGDLIRNCFSLSVLVNQITASAGFAMNNSVDGSTGSYENCYYFINKTKYNNDGSVNQGETQDKGYYPDGDVNSIVGGDRLDGVEKLNAGQFANLGQYFGEYSYADTPSASAVWCFANNNSIMSSVFGSSDFNTGRLELVAPNVIAFSQQELRDSVEDKATGQTTYYYAQANTSYAQGTMRNPYVIESAQALEHYMLEAATSSYYNDKHYRLISDINYSGLSINSQLYKLTYFGTFEGNGMTISQISLVSTDSVTNAGLFGQIGRDVTHQGTVMNLTLSPKEVTFVNANCVGALAGTLSYGNVYNVEVTKKVSTNTSSNLVVQGKNFVGGVIGRTLNSFTIKNVTSDVSAVANYTPQSTVENENSYSQSQQNLDAFSYAGGVVGFAAGNGSMQKLYSNAVTDVMGDRVGTILGGFDTYVTADYLYANIAPDLIIKAYSYGGLAVGEVKGILSHVQVGGAPSENYFSLLPEKPTAVGGIAGLLSGGQITDSYMGQEFTVNDLIGNTSTSYISSVGGIVGRVANGTDSTISKTIVAADISAVAENFGGVAGKVESGLTISEVAVQSQSLKLSRKDSTNQTSARIADVYVGGLIGRIQSGNVQISDSYTLADLIVTTYVYNFNISAAVGHFVGQGTPRSMSHTFGTGSISVTLEDRRQTIPTEQVTRRVLDRSSEDYNPLYGYYRAGRDISDVYISDVYYFGYKGTEEINDLGGSTDVSRWITFMARTLYNKASLTQNQLGQACYDANNFTIYNYNNVDGIYENLVNTWPSLESGNWIKESNTSNKIILTMENNFGWLNTKLI